MNCPSRVDPEALPNGWNQNPNAHDLDTNEDFNGRTNLRQHRDHRISSELPAESELDPQDDRITPNDKKDNTRLSERSVDGEDETEAGPSRGDDLTTAYTVDGIESRRGSKDPPRRGAPLQLYMKRCWSLLAKFGRFIGPGFMVAVSYIDPGNYATDIAAGASYRFQLLVMILVSNIIAVFLQTLSIKLGSVTGLNLAENCRAHFPKWLNYVLYFFAEAAIIATDIAEVIGTAIALNLLLHVPIVAGCAISIVDVFFILLFYSPSGTMRGLRWFEVFVMCLVLGVVVCFCVELSLVSVPNVGELFRGFLPSRALVEAQGLYQACGILGATVMPHALYLGSGIVQPRLREYDVKKGNVAAAAAGPDAESMSKYRPTLAAIKSCMTMSIVELTLALFTFALFVNSAILIVSGASLYGVDGATEADLFGIHDLLSSTLSPAAGTIFALALLLSGVSAGIVCTIAGQMVSEGQLRWSVRPWVRRLLTRSISITPSIIVAGALGKAGLSAALTGSQVALSVILPFVSAPLIYFTCRGKIMTVNDGMDGVVMKNSWWIAGWGVALWLLIAVMNVALIVLVGMGLA